MRVKCLKCSETSKLKGTKTDEGIRIACKTCGHSWLRTEYTCSECGGETLTDVRVPILQKARGSQHSILGYRIVKECTACGATSGDSTWPEYASG